jgi:hypothetical protein
MLMRPVPEAPHRELDAVAGVELAHGLARRLLKVLMLVRRSSLISLLPRAKPLR